jgi:hypothetical protein
MREFGRKIEDFINWYTSLEPLSKTALKIVTSSVLFIIALWIILKILLFMHKQRVKITLKETEKFNKKQAKKKEKKENYIKKISLKKLTNRVTSTLIVVIWGIAGSGKSITTMAIAKQRLVNYYKYAKKKIEEWSYTNPQKVQEYLQLKQNGEIPIVSNHEVEYKGSKSLDLDTVLLRQRKAPYLATHIGEEFGEIFGKARYHNRTPEERVQDALRAISIRYGRHEHSGVYLFNEQDKNNIATEFARYGYTAVFCFKKPIFKTFFIWKILKEISLAINLILPGYLYGANFDSYNQELFQKERILWWFKSLLPACISRKDLYFKRKNKIKAIFKFLFERITIFPEHEGQKFKTKYNHWNMFAFVSTYHQKDYLKLFDENGIVKAEFKNQVEGALQRFNSTNRKEAFA